MKRKCRFLLELLAVALLCFATAMLAACNGDNNSVTPDGGNEGTNDSDHEHTFAEKWSSDNEYHWHAATCGHDDQMKDKAKHELVWTVTTPASCEGDGEQTGTCVCGYSETKPIDALGHDFENATWQHDDIAHWHKCTRCNETDEHIAHDLEKWVNTQEPDCTAAGKKKQQCSVCGELYGEEEVAEALGHDFNTAWSYDNDKHWHQCSRCDETDDHVEHTVEKWNEIKPAEYDKDGEATGECTKCGATVTKILERLQVYDNELEKLFTFKFHDATYHTEAYYEIEEYKGSEADVVIPSKYKNVPVTSIGKYAFEDCTNLQTVTIGEGVTQIGYGAFWGCTGLQTAIINAQSIGDYAFDNCTGLQTVTIGEGVTSIAQSAFAYCTGLTEISIPDSVENIGESAFRGCSNLQTAIINAQNIDKKAFSNCDGLQTVTIGEGVHSIGDYAFDACRDLIEITIPKSMQSIGSYAFSGCHKLVHIRNLSEAEISRSPAYIDGEVKSKDEEFQNKLEKDSSGLWTYTVGDTVYAIKYDGENTDLDLSRNKSIDEIYTYAFYRCARFTSVIIPDSVTYIDGFAFEYCTNLQTAIINAQSIGGSVFEYCTNLQTVTIGEGVQSIGYSAFDGCISIATATMPAWAIRYIPLDYLTTVTITKGAIGEKAFSGCTNLQTVTIGEGVQSIGVNAFKDCENLQTVTIGEDVQSIGVNAFNGCTNLQTVNWNAINCTEVGDYYDRDLFDECTQLTTVKIGEKVQTTPNALFRNCTNLQKVTISEGVQNIGYSAFEGCTGLTEITIPGSVQSIGYSAFSYCEGLQTVILGEGVTCIGGSAFAYCADLKEITVPGSVTEIGGSAFAGCAGLHTVQWNATNCTTAGTNMGIIFADCTQLKTVIIADKVQTIPDFAFASCTGLTEITIPGNVQRIGYSAFNGCTGLQAVTIGEGVQNIADYAFKDCTGLQTAIINAQSIGEQAFYECTGLQTVTIGESVQSIGEDAFTYCTGLQTAVIDAQSIGYSSFSYCEDLQTVTIGEGVQSIGEVAFLYCTGLTTVNWNATNCTRAGTPGWPIFADCTHLTTVNIGDNVQTIPANAYYGCESLSEITIPGSVHSIGSEAFTYCTGLRTAIIYAQSIDDHAFSHCEDLQTVTIGKGVTSIGGGAFDWTNLQAVYYEGTSDQWGDISMDDNYGYNNYLLTAKRYYFSAENPYKNETAKEGEEYWHWNEEKHTPEVWTDGN